MRLSVWIWPHSKRICSSNRKKLMPIFSEINEMLKVPVNEYDQ